METGSNQREAMREILFRGKRVDNGEWVEGHYFTDQVSKGSNPCVDISLIRNDLHEDFEVKENTVGQFTGLTDKNGTKMFEGDILDYGISKNHVVFLEGSFGIINQSEQGSSFGSYDIDNGVIIGNIHDNPELK